MARDVMLQVLTNRSLLIMISEFISGLPYFVHQVKSQLTASRESHFVWRQEVELWRAALCCGDKRTLKGLLVLSQTKGFERLQRMFSHIIGFAVTHTKDLALLDWIYAHFQDEKARKISYKQCEALGRQGDVDIVKWAFSRGCRVNPIIACGAASAGQLDLIKFLHESGKVEFSPRVMDEAAIYGHLDVVRFLHENRAEGCSERAIDGAARKNHVDCVKYIHETFPERFTRRREEIVKAAAANGSLECIEYFHRVGSYPFTSKVMHHAATEGHLKVVKFLHKHRTEGCRFETIFEADRRGQHHVVHFLLAFRPMKYPKPAVERAKSEGRFSLAVKIETEARAPRKLRHRLTPAFLRRMSSSTYHYPVDD